MSLYFKYCGTLRWSMFSELHSECLFDSSSLQKRHQIILRYLERNLMEIQSVTPPSTPTAVCGGLIVCVPHVLLYNNTCKHIGRGQGLRPAAKFVPGQEDIVMTLAFPRVYTSWETLTSVRRLVWCHSNNVGRIRKACWASLVLNQTDACGTNLREGFQIMALCGKTPKDWVEDEWRAAREWNHLCVWKKSDVRLLRFYQEIILAFPSVLRI